MLLNRTGTVSLDPTGAAPDLSWLDRKYGNSVAYVVFDFDGVLTSPLEDLAYKLDERPDERSVLDCEAARHGIVSDIYDTAYLRHLVLQAVLLDAGELPEPGPLLPLAKALTAAGRPFFVLTARSGRAAVARMMAFLAHHELEPQEVFCVGRVPKGRQLALLGTANEEGHRIVYFEDTERHVRNSAKQAGTGVSTVHVAWNPAPWAAAEELVSRTLWRDPCPGTSGINRP